VYFKHGVLSVLTDRFDHSFGVLDSQRHREAGARSRSGSGDEPTLGLGSDAKDNHDRPRAYSLKYAMHV
jgi:hypothetical protein